MLRTTVGLDAKPMPTLHVVLPMPGSERKWWDVQGLVQVSVEARAEATGSCSSIIVLYAPLPSGLTPGASTGL